jgi:AhpD family alkylhydroperoxidase
MADYLLAEEYREGLESFGRLMPNVLSAYNKFTAACFEAGEIKTKDKHLMALAISLFSGNEHCMLYHLELALNEGATEEEIVETVAVAGAYGGGTTFSHGAILINDVLQMSTQSVQ